MALKNRKDMDPRFQWKLSDIFETPEAWEAAYAKAKKAVEELGALEGTLKQSAESLKSGLDQIYAATEQEVRATIGHLTRRWSWFISMQVSPSPATTATPRRSGWRAGP